MIRPLKVVLVVFIFAGTALAQVASPDPSFSLPQFQGQLEQLDAQVADLAQHPQTAEALRTSLPKHWMVTGGRFPVEVSTAFLEKALSDFQKQGPGQKKIILSELHTQLVVMRTGLNGFTQSEAVNEAMRKRLDEILAAREFKDVHGPTLFDTWMEALQHWLTKWWHKLFDKLDITAPEFTWVGRIFIWLIIAAAASVLAVWLYRVYRRKPVEYTREIMPFAPSAKSWRIWLAEAREQAAKGDWRNAIHLAYWASVSYLEASGLWIPDRARTPREYLREVRSHDPKKPAFTSLTRRFENVWYGSQHAGAADFDATLAELEKLGCQ
ncbi:MAG: DUF4129 domain-containing protein [Terriglobales bacterium]